MCYLLHFCEAGRAVARGSRGLGAAPELGATTETLALIPSGAGGLRLSYSDGARWLFLGLAARSLVFDPKYDRLSRDKRPGRGKCRK